MGELQHQESLGNGLDPGTDQGQSLATDISAKIADGESGAELMEPLIWLDCRRHGLRAFKSVSGSGAICRTCGSRHHPN
jgi:hypothetical protein